MTSNSRPAENSTALLPLAGPGYAEGLREGLSFQEQGSDANGEFTGSYHSPWVSGSRREVRDQALGRAGPRPAGRRWSVRGGGDVYHQPGVCCAGAVVPRSPAGQRHPRGGGQRRQCNAATGAQGAMNAARTAELAGEMLGCRPDQVLVASTGVIGHQLPMDRLEEGLKRVISQLSADPGSFQTAAQAILTTDTRAKVVALQHQGQSDTLTLFGMAKGAAMIGPRMATMLAFLLTDAPVWPNDLQPILSDAVENSFNCVSVEGHTSTNDTVLILSSTAATEPVLSGDDLTAFAAMVNSACESLARMMAADGE